MSLDDLSAPLGTVRPRGFERVAARISRAGVWVSVAVLLFLAGLVFMRSDPLGGEPFAVAVLDRVIAAPTPAPKTPDAARPGNPFKRRENASDLEAASGVKVTRPGESAAPGSVVITVPDETPAQSAKLAAPESRFFERSRFGQLPRVAGDGARPFQFYARPFTPPPGGAGRPRIAIVLTGLGIGAGVTADAIAKLPPEVSFAFAPYGVDLERQVARARGDGHEVLLQVPMEPFDYPDNDPGPHTLLASAKPEENIERLHWLLSRFPGFIGISTFMGARFTASEAALRPIVQESAKRGLMVFDDGSSLRSLVVPVGLSSGAPVARADIALDVGAQADTDEIFSKLEKVARDRGIAVGVAPALPGMIERLSRWSATLTGKGFVLAPVSAVLQKPR